MISNGLVVVKATESTLDILCETTFVRFWAIAARVNEVRDCFVAVVEPPLFEFCCEGGHCSCWGGLWCREKKISKQYRNKKSVDRESSMLKREIVRIIDGGRVRTKIY